MWPPSDPADGGPDAGCCRDAFCPSCRAVTPAGSSIRLRGGAPTSPRPQARASRATPGAVMRPALPSGPLPVFPCAHHPSLLAFRAELIPKSTLKRADRERLLPCHEIDPLARSDVSLPPPLRPPPWAASWGGSPLPAPLVGARAFRVRSAARGRRAPSTWGISRPDDACVPSAWLPRIALFQSRACRDRRYCRRAFRMAPPHCPVPERPRRALHYLGYDHLD